MSLCLKKIRFDSYFQKSGGIIMDTKKKMGTPNDPENEEEFAHSAELMRFGGIQFYVRWDV